MGPTWDAPTRIDSEEKLPGKNLPMVVDQFTQVFGSNPVVHGLVGGLVIASLNLPGASLIFVWRNPSERAMDGGSDLPLA